MYFRALHAIATRSFKLSTRKFILDLFSDLPLTPSLISSLNDLAPNLVVDEEELDAQVAEAEKAEEEEQLKTLAESQQQQHLVGMPAPAFVPDPQDEEEEPAPLPRV